MLAGLLLAATPAAAHPPTPPPFLQGPPAVDRAVTAPRGGTLPLAPSRAIDIDVDEGTWLSPDLTPDGRTIVFELLGDLYSLPVSGGQARQLTRGMAFDAQPAAAPDGRRIAFVSDRSGAENLWIADLDGRNARQVTTRDDDAVLTSPAWSADGRALFVSRSRADLGAYELHRADVATGEMSLLVPVKASSEQARADWSSALGAAPSPDGRFLYYAKRLGEPPGDATAEWTIVRRDLASGAEETIVSAPRSYRPDLLLGTAFRPALSPDGKRLVYGARDRGRTGLRLLDLETREDRWLALPVQQDETGAGASRDLLPRHTFTSDGRALIVSAGGGLQRIDVASGAATTIPFRVRTRLDLGAPTRQSIREDTGPVRARIMQDPVQSPDGRMLAFSALGGLYVMPLAPGATPRRLADGAQPSWSPDGRTLAFVRWSAAEAGHVWTMPAVGGEARRISDVAAHYTHPTFTPDDAAVVALRSSQVVRMHAYMEYGVLRQAELVSFDARSEAPARVIASGMLGGVPHFGPDAAEAMLLSGEGVTAVRLDNGVKRKVASVTGPGWYFAEGRAQADELRVSPDGRWALAQIAQQLHLVELPADGRTVDLDTPGVRHRKLTDVGADFFGWADGGRAITWAVGSTYYRRPLAEVVLDAAEIAEPRGADVGGEAFEAAVTLPRATPLGGLLLRGATVLTMRGEEAIADADLLITDGRIAAVGARGSVAVPAGASVRDVSGKHIIPGLIETHTHIADVRRGVLDLQSWGPLAALAYGVTTSFDPSTLSIDMLAYGDAVDAGLMVGSRIRSTGPALFSFNTFRSAAEVEAVLRRYRDHYRLRNIKMYRTGNRRVRQWIAAAAGRLGLHPTTEGALSTKLMLANAIDGYAGVEHALTATPIREDIVALMAGSGVGYSATLMIGNGGPQGQDWFITRTDPLSDAKLGRFAPRYVVDMKTRTRTWREAGEYLFPAIAADAARLQREGALVGMGSHGEVPGLGFHWEMQAHVMGGMTPMEALHAATRGSAAVIGRETDLGSIEPGKLADLIILDRDPRTDIRNALAIDAVMLEGRLRDGDTLDELWPQTRPLPRRWWCDDRPPGTPDPCPPAPRTAP